MSRHSWVILTVIFASVYLALASYLPGDQKDPTATKLKYTTTHSLGRGYTFDPRDGWQTVNVSNLSYKYSPRSPDIRRTTKIIPQHTSHNSLANKVKETVKYVFKSPIGKGKSMPVTITWYSGKDLLNPSCWETPVWAPTDNSFVCALTQEGWMSKPKCFQFLELCNGPEKCVFVRVVDSCAGCAKGSSHVDLTKAAFSRLANLDMGVLQVEMRPATEPTDWLMELWGPQAKHYN